jgi:hypothetical protein
MIMVFFEPSLLYQPLTIPPSEYTIDNWPVSLQNEMYLEEIKPSFNVQQLPAYNIRGKLIHPSAYEEKLVGAIVCVCFSLIHFVIKQKHIYNAIACDITVLRAPTTITSSSSSIKEILHPKHKKQRVM